MKRGKKKTTPSFIRLYQHHCHHIVTRSLLKSAFLVCFSRFQSSMVKFIFRSCSQPNKPRFASLSTLFEGFGFRFKIGIPLQNELSNYMNVVVVFQLHHNSIRQWWKNEGKKCVQTNSLKLKSALTMQRKKNNFDAYQMFVAHRFFSSMTFFALSLSFHH